MLSPQNSNVWSFDQIFKNFSALTFKYINATEMLKNFKCCTKTESSIGFFFVINIVLINEKPNKNSVSFLNEILESPLLDSRVLELSTEKSGMNIF